MRQVSRERARDRGGERERERRGHRIGRSGTDGEQESILRFSSYWPRKSSFDGLTLPFRGNSRTHCRILVAYRSIHRPIETFSRALSLLSSVHSRFPSRTNRIEILFTSFVARPRIFLRFSIANFPRNNVSFVGNLERKYFTNDISSRLTRFILISRYLHEIASKRNNRIGGIFFGENQI